MWSQLIRLKLPLNIPGTRSAVLESKYLGPMHYLQLGAKQELEKLAPDNKHWLSRGSRAVAIAATLLKNKEVIAIPTDTTYGLVCTIDADPINKVYEIKKSEERQPLPICVGNVRDIAKWCCVDHLPNHLLENIMPGPFTVILPRKATLNDAFGQWRKTVAVRVPGVRFIRSIATLIQPVILTSMNSNELEYQTQAEQFSDLWPQLGGIFYDSSSTYDMRFMKRTTVVNLSKPGRFSIVREGRGSTSIKKLFGKMGLRHNI